MASLTRLFTTIDLATERGVEVPCVREDAGLWFADDRASLDRAKTLCLSCPVQEECLAGATERGETGVWGAQLLNRGRISSRRPR
ncbi:MAG TPA: WhiB family transcriptional regulator [Pedococcus sp.]|nr:WhiB family transcriptional regulator [Pedococcus sp.]